jgi:hypothetical protein
MNPHKIGQGRSRQPAARESFTFPFMRDEELEEHTFRARVSLDLPTLISAIGEADRHPERAVSGLLRIVVKMLDNKDGVPAQWEPEPLPLPDPLPEGHDGEVRFRGPDGELYLLEEAAKFTAFEAGSSRRRWLHLIEEDDEIEVHRDDLMDLYKWLIGLAGKDLTPKSG